MHKLAPNNFSSRSVTDFLLQFNEEITTICQTPETACSFEQRERALHTAFVDIERRVLEKMLAQYDINVPVIHFEGTPYRQILRCETTYTSSAGLVRINRSLYRMKGGKDIVIPLELSAGIVERKWTPRAAKQAVFAVSQLTPYETEALFKELGAMMPSRASLDRLPKKLSSQWELHRESFEQSLSSQGDIPDQAIAVAVSLDGVKVPMQGGVVLPGDSRYEEASCGSITYYDVNGNPLSTRRYGRMPERKKVTMKSFLRKEIERALHSRPNLQLVKVADGAKDNWNFLDEELASGVSVLDFYHAAEHLKQAMDYVYGKGSSKSKTEFIRYRHILRHEQDGIEKVIRCLSRHVKRKPKKVLLKTELNYFRNNKKRCRYADIADRKLPIGSGIIEATCKTLVTQRLKRSGMAWQTPGGQAILTFRALLHSNLFEQGWEKLSTVYRGKIDMPINVVPFRKISIENRQ